jgi:hypothetical protein
MLAARETQLRPCTWVRTSAKGFAKACAVGVKATARVKKIGQGLQKMLDAVYFVPGGSRPSAATVGRILKR